MNESAATALGTRRSARLDLAFARGPDGRTFLERQFAAYPFHVCRAQYLDSALRGMATVYAQSCSGGIYAGDRLRIDVTVGEGAEAHFTTQASTVVHRTLAAHAEQAVHLRVHAGALLEFLPDPLILFPAAHLRARLKVDLEDGATVVLGDTFMAHDPAGESAPFGSIETTVEVRDGAGRLLVVDRYRVAGFAPGVNERHAVHGSFLVVGRGVDAPALVEAMLVSLDDRCGAYAGVSTLPNDCGAWGRITAPDAIGLRHAFDALWCGARRCLTGHPPPRRRK